MKNLGKTVVFAEMIPQLPNPFLAASKTLVLAHRNELLEQAKKHIELAHPNLKVSMEQGLLVADQTADVIVASVATLGRINSSRLQAYNRLHYKCIIIDEAHHAAASTYLRILDYFQV